LRGLLLREGRGGEGKGEGMKGEGRGDLSRNVAEEAFCLKSAPGALVLAVVRCLSVCLSVCPSRMCRNG